MLGLIRAAFPIIRSSPNASANIRPPGDCSKGSALPKAAPRAFARAQSCSPTKPRNPWVESSMRRAAGASAVRDAESLAIFPRSPAPPTSGNRQVLALHWPKRQIFEGADPIPERENEQCQRLEHGEPDRRLSSAPLPASALEGVGTRRMTAILLDLILVTWCPSACS